MRVTFALAVSALLALGTAAESLFQNDAVATVAQQRGRSLLQDVPLYGCPLSTYVSERKVEVYVTIKRPAFFGAGQKAIFEAIRPVFTKFGRDSIRQSQITGPRGQGPAPRANKTFLFIFTLPLGKCGSDKKLLDTNLRRAIATLKTDRIRGAKISLWK